MKKIVKLANTIYNTGYIPEEMYKSIFIAIPKKPGAADCSLFRRLIGLAYRNSNSHLQSTRFNICEDSC